MSDNTDGIPVQMMGIQVQDNILRQYTIVNILLTRSESCDSEQVQAWVDATDNEVLEEIRSTSTSNNSVDQQMVCDI